MINLVKRKLIHQGLGNNMTNYTKVSKSVPKGDISSKTKAKKPKALRGRI